MRAPSLAGPGLGAHFSGRNPNDAGPCANRPDPRWRAFHPAPFPAASFNYKYLQGEGSRNLARFECATLQVMNYTD